MAALTGTTKGLKRISEGMTYGEVLSDQMTFRQILKAHPRVRGIFET